MKPQDSSNQPSKSLLRKLLAPLALVAGLAVLAVAAEDASRHPAPSLTRPDFGAKAPNAAGFIQRWLILEPISSNGLTDSAVQAAVKAEYFANQFSVIPRDGDSVTVGGTNLTWHAVDTKEYNVNLYHFAHSLGKPSSFVLFWAVTVINCPQEMPDVRLAIGSNAASVWWVNGQEACGIYGDILSFPDDAVSKRITLKKGPNIIRGAVHNQRGQTDFCVRILDDDGNPVKNVTVSLSEDGK